MSLPPRERGGDPRPSLCWERTTGACPRRGGGPDVAPRQSAGRVFGIAAVARSALLAVATVDLGLQWLRGIEPWVPRFSLDSGGKRSSRFGYPRESPERQRLTSPSGPTRITLFAGTPPNPFVNRSSWPTSPRRLRFLVITEINEGHLNNHIYIVAFSLFRARGPSPTQFIPPYQPNPPASRPATDLNCQGR